MASVNQNMFLLMCDCACDSGITFRYDDEFVYISSFSGDFYSKQNTIKNSILDSLNLIRVKEKVVTEIMISKENVLELRDFLRSASFEKISSHEDNCSFLRFEYEAFCDACFVSIVSTQKWYEILGGKRYRAHEIILNKREVAILLNDIEKLIIQI